MGKCATKKPVRRYANGGMLDNPLEAVMPFEPRQPATNPLQNQVNALDQKIAMGNAMDGLSNTERYQLANPGNAAYKPGSMMAGTSADASMDRQQTSILQNLRSGIAAQMPSAIESKWIGGGTESPSPAVSAKPAVPSIGQGITPNANPVSQSTASSMGIKRVGNSFSQEPVTRAFAAGGVVGLVNRRSQQIEEAANYDTPVVSGKPPSPVKPSMGSQAEDYAAQAARIEAEQQATAKALMTPPKKKGFLGFANGGVPPKGNKQQIADGLAQRARFEGKGGPREDQIPVKVAGQNIKVSDGEEAMIIPAKTAANPEAMKAIMDIIRQTNDGREPGAQLKEGGKYARGLVERDFSIPEDQQTEATIAQANKAPYVATIQKPLNVKANFETPDISMLASDPRGYESARKMLAPEAPTARQAPVIARSLAASVEPVAQGLQERTFGAQAPRSISDIVQPTASPVAPNAMAGSATMNGKTVEIQKGGGYTDTAGNPTDDWTKTDRYAQAMQVNESMKRAANQMERNRYARDMQADITNPKVIALAKLNLDRMNQEDETQQQGIANGLDSRIKQNALAQSDQEQQMIGRLNDPSLTPDQRLALRSDLLAMKGKNPNEHRFYVGDDETTGIDGARTKKAVLLDALSPEGRMNGRQKLPLPQGMTAENVIAEAQKAIKSGKSQAAIAAELEKYGLSLS